MPEETHSNLLDAPHLTAVEEESLETPFTLPNAVDRLRRIGYWQRRLNEIGEAEQTLLAPLLAEVERIRAWAQTERELPRNRIAFHEGWLRAYYISSPPTKGKTIKLPGGEVSAKDGAPKWDWRDEKAAVATLGMVAPDLVYTKAEVNIDKNAVKEAAKGGRLRIEDGKVYVVTQDGERVELAGVTVEMPETEYRVKVEV